MYINCCILIYWHTVDRKFYEKSMNGVKLAEDTFIFPHPPTHHIPHAAMGHFVGFALRTQIRKHVGLQAPMSLQ
jgi:hypothetical protein